MLFKQAVLDGIQLGKVRLAFRRWAKPTVKPGTELHTKVGLVGIMAIAVTDATKITQGDARKSGFASREALLADLGGRSGTLYRIQLKYLGADPRIALRRHDKLGAVELAAQLATLSRFDRIAPWTRRTLDLIDELPGQRASELAARMGLATLPFKTKVRKLKALGLTESLETGYRLSPRGEVILKALRGKRT